jgi:hypothetical protein
MWVVVLGLLFGYVFDNLILVIGWLIWWGGKKGWILVGGGWN